MRTVIKSREFIMAAALVLIFSSFSFVISYKADQVCSITNECTQRVNKAAAGSELFWNTLLKRLITSVSFS